MCAIEHKCGLRIVIELPQLPASGVMAPGTIPAKYPFMMVILFMAVGASFVSFIELSGFMALVTGRQRVHANQRESSKFMIEP